MIVVIGSPTGRLTDGAISAGGAAARVALAAAGAGRPVQLVGKTGDDATADGVVLDLARGGVGHVALLRDPARATPLEPPADPDERDGLEDSEVSGTATATGTANEAPPPAAPTAPDGPSLEAADVDLGLRYLTDFTVIVLAEPALPEVVRIVAEAARWGEARLVLVVRSGERAPAGLPPDAVVLEAPASDPDGAFASLVGAFAAALDGGTEPGEAFRTSIVADGWTVAADD